MTYKIPDLSKISTVVESEARGKRLRAERDGVQAHAGRLRQTEINGPDEDTRAERLKRAEKRLAGQAVPPPLPVGVALAAALSQLADLEAACELHDKQHAKLLRDEEAKLRQALQAPYDVEAKRFATALSEMHSALCSMERMKRELRSNGLGFDPPCKLDTDFLESPFNKTSNIASLLRECVANKYLAKIPAEVR